MVETVVMGTPEVMPRGDGGRNLRIIAGPNHAYVIPLSAELIAGLTMSDEELQRNAQRQAAASKLAIAQNMPTNGNGLPR